MNITLEEQIEYMRGECELYRSRAVLGCFPEFTDMFNKCKAILATLEAVMDEQKAFEETPQRITKCEK